MNPKFYDNSTTYYENQPMTHYGSQSMTQYESQPTTYYQNPSKTSHYPTSTDGDRFLGGFAVPFILGGVTGAAIANNRPYPVPYPAPYPYPPAPYPYPPAPAPCCGQYPPRYY